MQWNSFVQATKVVQVSLGRFEDAISVMNEDTQTLVDTDWPARRRLSGDAKDECFH